MADKDSGAPSQRIEDLERENEVLRERLERADEATVEDMPQAAQPELKSYAVEVRSDWLTIPQRT